MTGIFSRWQPAYADHRIATFPVNESKRPRIKGWQKVGLRGSAELADKFTDADALGYVTGRRSNITVVDIDTIDEKIAEDAIRRHGQPVIVLGDNGFALAAPSKLATGSYEIIHGRFDDLDRLRPMVGAPLTLAAATPLPAKWTGMRQGDGRNRALWERCMRTGGGCSLDRMMEVAREANQMFEEPMMDAEVVKIATSAWKHDAAGLNFFTRPRIMLDHDIFDTLGAENSDALLLLLRLERYHGGNDRFALAKPMATSMGWSIPRWKAARSALAQAGIIRCFHPGGRGPNDPPIYRWTLKGS